MIIKNTKVKELIEILSTMDPNAVVCNMFVENNKSYFSTFEICNCINNISYIDDSGNEIIGDIVYLY